jgi:uncharacterized protein YecE (DUF72 family)
VEAAKLYVGTAGWSYADWNGIVYPTSARGDFHPLDVLSGWFNTVEINASFYRPPLATHAEAWVRRVSGLDDFQFTAKLWQRFTHQRESWPAPGEIEVYKHGVAPLVEAGRLGALLAQFPWSFRRTPENRTWLARMADCFAGYPLVVEVRHTSWDRPEVFEGLRERGIAFCNIDQPVIGDSIGPSAHVTAPLAYVRFHGRNYENWFREGAGQNERYDYLYSEDELKPWLGRLKQIQAQSRSLYVVTNNHFQGQAVVNALEIYAALGAAKYAQLPPGLLHAYPRLRQLLRET